MANQLRGYRLRCYPTRSQQARLARLFGAARWVWNKGLAAISQGRNDPELVAMFGRGLSIGHFEFGRVLTQLKKEAAFAWLAECNTSVLTQALWNLHRAYLNFCHGRARYPRFKTRDHAQSIRYSFHHHHPGKVRGWREGRLILPALGQVDVVWSRQPSAVPKMVTVSRDRAGRYSRRPVKTGQALSTR